MFEVLHLLGVGDVAWFGDDVRAEQRVHLGGEFLHLVLFGGQVDQGHVRSGLGQRRGRVASQPAGGSGDESLPAFHGELVGERVSGVLPPVQRVTLVEDVLDVCHVMLLRMSVGPVVPSCVWGHVRVAVRGFSDAANSTRQVRNHRSYMPRL
ncbi:unknown [Eggerthella sp. CAG:1427]|nr:unknown [Eggerthella sp. CAG:1427]